MYIPLNTTYHFLKIPGLTGLDIYFLFEAFLKTIFDEDKKWKALDDV